MTTLLIAVHLLLALAIIAAVLLQRSEGGALGIGGGGGSFMTGRGTASFLTRFTAFLGICFFLTSIGLTLLARQNESASILDDLPQTEQPAAPLILPGITPPQP